MADPTDELPPDDFENGGGPVKTFLEHLEDLRWLLVKSGVALVVCLIVCLYATDKIVWLLKRPLQQAALIKTDRKQKILVRFGTNTLITLDAPANQIGPRALGTNRFVVCQAEPVADGTNFGIARRW